MSDKISDPRMPGPDDMLLTCLECGHKKKMIQRHLWSTHKRTPEQYREKFGLPDDYPMVAPGLLKDTDADSDDEFDNENS
jgi:predicted transcriptional regulator